MPFGGVPWKEWAFLIVALVLLGLGSEAAGFYESAFGFLLVVTWLLSRDQPSWQQRLLAPLVFAVGFDAVLYVAFKVILAIPTPRGLLL